jgi:hypothetical protein
MTPEPSNPLEKVYREAIENRHYTWSVELDQAVRSAHMRCLNDSLVDKEFKKLYRPKTSKTAAGKVRKGKADKVPPPPADVPDGSTVAE